MTEGTGIQFLKHQILIQISYCINLIPGNCAIAELLTMCILIFDKMNMFSHFFTVLVTFLKVAMKSLTVLSCCQHLWYSSKH